MSLVVTGAPRSGTSLMMRILIEALGADRCLGTKHPAETAFEKHKEQREDETDVHYAARAYSHKIDPEGRKFQRMITESMAMNPDGFWEDSKYVGRGLSWHQGIDIKPEHFVKVIFKGLARSDPRFVSKVIVMARHPRAICKSQEKLKHGGVAANVLGKIQNPGTYVDSLQDAAAWLAYNAELDVMVVKYDDLIDKPYQTVAAIGAFVGPGDWDKAKAIIKPALRRSVFDNPEDDLWPDAEAMYDLLCANPPDFEGIVDFANNLSDSFKQNRDRWVCARNGLTVSYRQCEGCFDNALIRDNYRKRGADAGIDYVKEPCLYVAGLDLSRDYEPGVDYIQLSIDNNHWVEDREKALHLDCKHRGTNAVDLRRCRTCGRGVEIKVFVCDNAKTTGLCAVARDVGADVTVCATCPHYADKSSEPGA